MQEQRNPFPVIVLGILAAALFARLVLPWSVRSEVIGGLTAALYVLLFLINYFLATGRPPEDRRLRLIPGTGEELTDEDEPELPALPSAPAVHRLPEPAGKVVFDENGKAVTPSTLEQWRINQNEQ